MSSVLADFTAQFAVEADGIETPTTGRLVLRKDQLVLAATADEQLAIPLSAVFDIRTGSVPQLFDPLPGTPVTVAFERAGGKEVALIATDEPTVRKFTTILFKTILNGTHATIKHPAKLGGRVLDAGFRSAVLAVERERLTFETGRGPVVVALDGVIDFSREQRTIDGLDRSVVVVDHVRTGDTITTVAATDSARTLSVLGRYLRREYDKQMATLRELSLSEAETELLTTLYSTGDRQVSLASVLGTDPDQIRKLLHALHEKGLVESGEHAPILTSTGQIVVTQYLERVNA
ncbi:CheF family chemotaxis protein [Halovenus sp. HT40]|uniref:CheF family chemotaxis protein n=1 Tax=Halovenus sp. HT40 TaxID=3126691 RepID=UPI00300EAFD9